MPFETKNGSTSILYHRQEHTHASINNDEPFQVGSNSAVPQDNPRDSLSFLSALHSSNHGLRDTLGNMECKSLPVLATIQLFCHSSNILCFANGRKFRATDYAMYMYTLLPKVACLASKSALSLTAIPTCAGIHSRSLRASCQHFCLHPYTNG
jgi:hypothetical protein